MSSYAAFIKLTLKLTAVFSVLFLLLTMFFQITTNTNIEERSDQLYQQVGQSQPIQNTIINNGPMVLDIPDTNPQYQPVSQIKQDMPGGLDTNENYQPMEMASQNLRYQRKISTQGHSFTNTGSQWIR